MAIVVSNAGEQVLLNIMFKNTSPPDITLHVFSSNSTLDENTDESSLTEASFSGYSPKTLLRSNFNDATSDGTSAYITYPQQTWDASSTENCFGVYYMTDSTSPEFIGAERFPETAALVNSAQLQWVPRIELKSQN